MHLSAVCGWYRMLLIIPIWLFVNRICFFSLALSISGFLCPFLLSFAPTRHPTPTDTPTHPHPILSSYLSVYGYDHAPHGHAVVRLVDVRVPKSAMLLGEVQHQCSVFGFRMRQETEDKKKY